MRYLHGRNRSAYDQVKAGWDEVCEVRSAGSANLSPFAAKLVDKRGFLSLSGKVAITCALSELTKKEFAARYQIKLSTLQSHTEPGRPSREIHDVARYVEAANALSEGPQRISPTAFREREFSGPNAVADFAAWLLGERVEPARGLDLWNARDKYLFLETLEREAITQAVLQFLGDENGPQVQVVYAKDMSRALTGFADMLIGRLKADPGRLGGPILYLPVSAYVPDYKKIDLPLIVGWLEAFYAGRQLKDARSPGTSAEMTDAFDNIRNAMAKQPATIILNGYPDYRGVLGDLRALVSDDATTQLLKHILHPSTADTTAPFNVADFKKTRIVLLADGPVQWLSPFAARSIELPLPTADKQKELIHEKYYANPKEVLTYLDKYALAQNETNLLLVDSCVSAQALLGPQSTITVPGEERAAALAETLIGDLRQTPTNAYVLVTLLGLSLDGIRVGTAVRVLRRWARMQQALQAADLPPIFEDQIDVPSILALAQALEGLIIVVDSIAGRSLTGRAGFEVSDRGGGAEQEQKDSLRILMFRRPEIRQIVTEALLESTGPEMVAVLQRLLAEDAISRYTFFARHSDRIDTFDMRIHRSLVRALYHGFNSLMAPEKVLRAEIETRPDVLPSSATEAYRRLYSNFYRLLLEAPPNWEVSRTMGAAAVKRDLILVAMNAPVGNQRRYPTVELDRPLNVKLPLWLLEDGLPGAHELIEDMIAAYARAAIQLDDFRGLEQLEEEIERAQEASAKLGDTLSLLKVRIDALILQNDFDEAQALIQADLKAAGIDWETLNSATLELAGRIQGMSDASSQIERSAEQIARSLLPIDASPELLARLSDMLSRRAEILSQVAQKAQDPSASTVRFLQAFITFLVAERCRRWAFLTAPLSRSHLVSGHQTWAFVRTALLLVKYGMNGPGALTGLTDYLIAKAQRQSDILARYNVRYAAERSSLLLMEAAIARVGTRNLPDAQYLLCEADRRMIWATDRPRVRMRLLYQRCAFLMEQAAALEDKAMKLMFLDAAEFDHRQLAALARYSGARQWIEFAADRERQLRDARGSPGTR